MSDDLQERLPVYDEDFGLMIEAGFVAVKQSDEKSARALFEAAEALRPTSTIPQIGIGYIALNKLDTKEADRLFESVIAKEPENWLAQMFLGISYVIQPKKREQGEKLIRVALDRSDEPTVQQLGKVALEWVEKDLNKPSSPFFAKAT